MFSAVVAEHLFYKAQMTRSEIARMARFDTVYGVSAITVLIFGLLLWLKVGKPAEFYSGNTYFNIKLLLFVLVGLLSIRPTVFFMKQRKGAPSEMIDMPKDIVWLIRIELLILIVMPLLATLMANGYGK